MITIIVIFLHPAHHHLSLVIHFQLPSSLLSQVRAWICQRRESRTEPEGSSSNTLDGNSITMDGNTIATSYFSPEHQQGQPPCLLLSQSSAAMVSQFIMLFFLALYNRPSYMPINMPIYHSYIIVMFRPYFCHFDMILMFQPATVLTPQLLPRGTKLQTPLVPHR